MYPLVYPPMYPLKFHPVYKEKIWGGDALARLFGRQLPSRRVGESWEIAAHPHGQSIVSNGPLAGTALVDLLKSRRDEIMGKTPLVPVAGGGDRERFPLLIKLLDCNDWLSVQVHPDDEYARAHEGELGKTESWVVLYAAPGAQIVYGLEPGTTRDEFAAAIAQNRVEEYLHKVEVRAGDIFSVPSGTVHALGRGVVVAEIQQNSDTVYRVYDWGRLGDDGKPRELHVEKALSVIDFSFSPAKAGGGRRQSEGLAAASTAAGSLSRPANAANPAADGDPANFVTTGAATVTANCCRTLLDANDKYVIERIELTGESEWTPAAEDRFSVFMLLRGRCRVAGGGEELLLRAGDSVLVPAAVTDLSFQARAKARAKARAMAGPQPQELSETEATSEPVVLLRAYVPDVGQRG